MAGDGSKIALMPNERVIMSSDEDTLALTNVRVRLNTTVSGSSKLVTIVLDAVASCALVTRSQPLLIVLGALAILGAFTQQGIPQIGFFGVGVILIIAYFYTRNAVLTITSTGGSEIMVPAKGMARASIVEFVDAVEKAKLSFLAEHCGSPSL